MHDQRTAVAAALLEPPNRAATAAGDVGAVVRAARRALGWSQSELAKRVGYSQATISRLERAATRATQDSAVLADVAEALQLPRTALGLAAPRSTDAGSTIDDVKRRDFLSSAAGLTAVALLPEGITSPAHIGQEDIDQTWVALQRLFQLDDRHGGTKVYQVAAAMAQKLDSALRQARFTDSVGRQLRLVTATTMEHAGWLAYDAGQGASARRWWLETIHLARDLGDVPEAHVAALASMSLYASRDRRRGRETISLAQAARIAASHRASSTLLSVLAAREAVGHAQLGDKAATRSSIAEARRWMDQSHSPNEPLWLQFWCPADLACHETRVALALGNGVAAEKAARSALSRADEQRFPRNHAIYSVRLAAVLTRTGQLDEAIAVATNAVKRLDQISGSRRIVNDLSETLNQLSVRSYGPARQFATAARRLLPVT